MARKKGKRRGRSALPNVGAMIRKGMNWLIDGLAAGAGAEVATSSGIGTNDGVLNTGLQVMGGQLDPMSGGQRLINNFTQSAWTENAKKMAAGTFLAATPTIVRKGISMAMRMFKAR